MAYLSRIPRSDGGSTGFNVSHQLVTDDAHESGSNNVILVSFLPRNNFLDTDTTWQHDVTNMITSTLEEAYPRVPIIFTVS